MIIEKNTCYKPITITLETEEEAIFMMTVMGSICGDPINSPRKYASKIYVAMDNYGIDTRLPKGRGFIMPTDGAIKFENTK